MSEDAILSLTTLILATLGPIIMLIVKAKLAQDNKKTLGELNRHNELDQAVVNDVKTVIDQNAQQLDNQQEMHAKNTAKLETIQHDLNGRLAEMIAAKVKEELQKQK